MLGRWWFPEGRWDPRRATREPYDWPGIHRNRLIVPPVRAAFNIEQHAKVGALAGGTTQAISLTNPVVVGRRLILGISAWDSSHTVTSITDGLGNSWPASPLARTADGDLTDATIWDVPITVGGSLTVTGHAGGSMQWSMFLIEVSGLSSATTSYTDGLASATGASGTPSSGAASPTAGADAEFQVGLYADGGYNDTGPATLASGWTVIDTTCPGTSDAEGTMGYLTAGTTNGVGANFQTSGSVSHNWAALTAVFKLAPPAAAAVQYNPTYARISGLRVG
jgi:hypothetical protein